MGQEELEAWSVKLFADFKAEGVEIELRVLNKTRGPYDELSKMVKIISVSSLGPEISTKT